MLFFVNGGVVFFRYLVLEYVGKSNLNDKLI